MHWLLKSRYTAIVLPAIGISAVSYLTWHNRYKYNLWYSIPVIMAEKRDYSDSLSFLQNRDKVSWRYVYEYLYSDIVREYQRIDVTLNSNGSCEYSKFNWDEQYDCVDTSKMSIENGKWSLVYDTENTKTQIYIIGDEIKELESWETGESKLFEKDVTIKISVNELNDESIWKVDPIDFKIDEQYLSIVINGL